jgi:hypothetical protein
MSIHQPHTLRQSDCEATVTVTASNEVGISRHQLRVAAISATANAGQR